MSDLISGTMTEQIMGEQWTYYAFISYKHEDEKWAKWIQNKLETYKFPTILQKENRDLPKKISPIFRDKTDITAGPLKQTLSKELQASKYLIVICSTKSAGSPYVNYEVEQFIQLGRQDRIIPLIINGEVDAKEADRECYVPALLSMDESILGVDLKKLGKRKSFLTIVAKMLGLRLDILINRDKQRQKKRALIFGSILMLSLIIGGFAWDYFVPKTQYYSDYVLQWGLPKGIFHLKKGIWLIQDSELKGRSDFYSITVQKSTHRITLKHLNSAKVPDNYMAEKDNNDRPVIAVYEYHLSDGHRLVRSATYKDRYGYKLYVLKYSDDATIVDFTSGDGSNTPVTLSSNLMNQTGILDMSDIESKSTITRHVYEYDEKGYIKSVKFFRDNRSMTPTPDKNGIIGYTCVVDHYGRIINKEMNYSFNNMEGSYIFDRIIYTYSSGTECLFNITYADKNGNPMLNKDGYSIEAMSYDFKGKLTDIYYYNNYRQPCFSKDGYGHLNLKYDKRNFINRVSYFDINNNPVIAACGYANAEFENDKKGNITKISVFNTDNKSMIATTSDHYKYEDGYSVMRIKYNRKNMVTRHSYYDQKGKAILNSLGVAGINIGYNKRGLVNEIAYFDSKGKPTSCKDGFVKFTKQYNNSGRITEWKYCNEDGSLINTNKGYARVTYEYDDNGNPTRMSYYNQDNQLAVNKDQFAQEEMVWDDRGLLLSHQYLDANGKLIDSVSGYAKAKFEFNENGLCTLESYYDKNNQLTILKNLGYAKSVASYNVLGIRTKLAYYDATGNLIINKNMGFAEYSSSFNDQGKLTCEGYYGARGELVLANNMDFAKHTIDYDEQGLPICECYYDASNQLTINNSLGFAKNVLKHDSWGNISETWFYNERSEEVTSAVYGYAHAKFRYDNNRILEERYYGTDDQLLANLYLVAGIDHKYDDNGNEIERVTIGADNRPTNALYNGYSKMIMRYDKNQKLKDTKYYDENGKKVNLDDVVTTSLERIVSLDPSSQGYRSGISVNDIIVSYGDWNWFNIENKGEAYSLFMQEISKKESMVKRVRIYRPSDQTIHTFDYKAGKVGIRVSSIELRFENKEHRNEFYKYLENCKHASQ